MNLRVGEESNKTDGAATDPTHEHVDIANLTHRLGYRSFRDKQEEDLRQFAKFPKMVTILEEREEKVIDDSEHWKKQIETENSQFKSMIKTFGTAVKEDHVSKLKKVEGVLHDSGATSIKEEHEDNDAGLDEEDEEKAEPALIRVQAAMRCANGQLKHLPACRNEPLWDWAAQGQNQSEPEIPNVAVQALQMTTLEEGRERHLEASLLAKGPILGERLQCKICGFQVRSHREMRSHFFTKHEEDAMVWANGAVRAASSGLLETMRGALRSASLLSLVFRLAAAGREKCQCQDIHDWNDPEFLACNIWGDPHVTASWRSPAVYDFQGLGAYRYASSSECGGDFELQAFHCDYGGKGNAEPRRMFQGLARLRSGLYKSVPIAIAVKMNEGSVMYVTGPAIMNTDTTPLSQDPAGAGMEDPDRGVNIAAGMIGQSGHLVLLE
eukprot:s342_g1.t1